MPRKRHNLGTYIAYQWHCKEEQTKHDRQHTNHKSDKVKATGSHFHKKVIIMLDNEQDQHENAPQQAAIMPHKEQTTSKPPP